MKYAATIYGFELSDLNAGQQDQPDTDNESQEVSQEAVLENRLAQDTIVKSRQEAVQSGSDNIRRMAQDLNVKRERHEIVKSSFHDFLLQLEEETHATALLELRRSLETLPPRQAKDLILRTLQDHSTNTHDDSLADVVTMMKAMPQDHLRKILGEFKTEPEREELHRVIKEIGELDSDGESS